MGILRDFERRLEGAVEGLFARAFRSGVQPVELGKRLVREVEDGRTVGVNRVYVPNVYVYQLSPGDRERFADYEVALGQELAALAVDTARERDWAMLGAARIEFETADDLEVGRFRLESRVEADEQERDYAAAGPAGAPGPRCRPRPAWSWSRAASRSGPGRWPRPRSRSAGPSSPTSPWPTRACPATTPGWSARATTSSSRTCAPPTAPRSTASPSGAAAWPTATCSSWPPRPCSSGGRADAADLPAPGQGRLPGHPVPVRGQGGAGGDPGRVRAPGRAPPGPPRPGADPAGAPDRRPRPAAPAPAPRAGGDRRGRPAHGPAQGVADRRPGGHLRHRHP